MDAEKDDWGPWRYIGGGLLSLALGAYFYWDLSRFEADPNGTRRLPMLVGGVYRIAGKWGVTLVLVALGLFICGFGVYQLMNSRKK